MPATQRHPVHRRPGRIGAAVLASVALAAVGAPPAQADDASVLRALESNDAAFRALGRQIDAGSRTFRATRRAGPLLGALARTRALIIETRKAVLAEQASTPTGAAARSASLRALGWFERSILSLRGATLATVRGQPRLALTLARRADALGRAAEAAAGQAIALFRQAGLSPRPLG